MELDHARFLNRLETLAQFGASGVFKGVVRPAYSEPDLAARDWIAQEMEQIGLEVQFDPVGNLFGLTEGQSILLGSHTDSQPQGGWLDGALGVIAALEIAQASMEAGGPPISVVNFQDEEGRFGVTTGSAIWSGVLPLEQADRIVDARGESFAQARSKLGMRAQGWVDPARFSAFLEMHIEQGPVLDQRELGIGVVSNIVGIRDMRVQIDGEQNHAGTTPMSMRKDAFQALASFAVTLNANIASYVTPETVWTIGHVDLVPNAASVVPGTVTFAMQWRDASLERLDHIQDCIFDTLQMVCAEHGVTFSCSEPLGIVPTQMDQSVQTALQHAAQELTPSLWIDMPSGALHDAANVAKLMPTGMLFVPSIGGLSHTFTEHTDPKDLFRGLDVLAAGVTRLWRRNSFPSHIA